jgi:transposase-like protein
VKSKRQAPAGEAEGLACPDCGSDALYRYGRTHSGKQRYRCILCGRQFVEEGFRVRVDNRPDCPKCQSPMHLYMRGKGVTRFRCADYPSCRTFVKVDSDDSSS